MKTRFHKAINDELKNESPSDNVNAAIKLSKEIKILDLIDANGKTICKVAEILNRLQNAEFEILHYDIGDYQA